MNLIGKHPAAVAGAQLGDLLKLCSRYHSTGRIVRIGQHQGAYAAGERCLQCFMINCGVRTQGQLDEFDACLRQLSKEGG